MYGYDIAVSTKGWVDCDDLGYVNTGPIPNRSGPKIGPDRARPSVCTGPQVVYTLLCLQTQAGNERLFLIIREFMVENCKSLYSTLSYDIAF